MYGVKCNHIIGKKVVFCGTDILHQITKCGGSIQELIAIFLTDPQDKSTIGLIWINHGWRMEGIWWDEKEITGGYKIGPFSYGDGNIPFQKKIKFIIVMEVDGNRF